MPPSNPSDWPGCAPRRSALGWLGGKFDGKHLGLRHISSHLISKTGILNPATEKNTHNTTQESDHSLIDTTIDPPDQTSTQSRHLFLTPTHPPITMVLELIIIGGVIYYYVHKRKQEYAPRSPYCAHVHKLTPPSLDRKAKNLALASGHPWTNKDGSITYPNPSSIPCSCSRTSAPEYTSLPPYEPAPAGDRTRQTWPRGDEKTTLSTVQTKEVDVEKERT